MTQPLALKTLGDQLLLGHAGTILLRRRIDLALLTVVADRSPRPVERELLQAFFWGERSEDKARHSLRQVVMRLRQACGDVLEITGTTIRLASGAISFDARDLAAAAAEGRYQDALSVWAGEFLPGCEHLGSEDFRLWLDVERERIRRLVTHCFESATATAIAAAQWSDAERLSERWIDAFPLDEDAHAQRIVALAALGRVADAVALRAAFIRRVEADLGEGPDKDWLAAAANAIASAPARVTALPPASAPDPVRDLIAAPAREAAMPRNASSTQRRRMLAVTAASAFAAAVIATLAVRSAGARSEQGPAVAIGEITSSLPRDTARGFATLLTITLSRVAALNVISERRIAEATSAAGGRSLEQAARAAGAAELVEGVLSRKADHALRADLRRVNLTTGRTISAFSVESVDLTELADLVVEQLARDAGVQPATTRREGVTRSIIAYGFYEQGLRAYNDGDLFVAHRFFRAALGEDSTFAMAAFYSGLTGASAESDTYMARAVRLAQRTSDRERLLISVNWGRRMSDPRVLAWAETLVTRYPGEPDGHIDYAREMLTRRNFAASLAHFSQVVRMDSAMGRGLVRCRACDGLDGLMATYQRMDSSAAEIAAGRAWLRLTPRSSWAWLRLSDALGNAGDFRAAHAAIDSGIANSTDPLTAMHHSVWWIRANEFARIDSLCAEFMKSTNADIRLDGMWTQMISLRTQGRVREALALARQFRRETAVAKHLTSLDAGGALPLAVALMESGQPRAAAALFDSIARIPQHARASRVGAHKANYLTFAASAYAAAGDTIPLAALEDSVRVNGALGTDRHKALFHYVRGLRLAARKRYSDAAEEYRAALGDRLDTHVRIYLELAKTLMAAGRPAEAIPPLRTALQGPTSAAGLYATRTELQELLGTAFLVSGRPDSARVQYALAAGAWRNADPDFTARRARMTPR
ncbi:hypothetical protein BH09GEM1_BH09GEM1_09680 [soil metagenome]